MEGDNLMISHQSYLWRESRNVTSELLNLRVSLFWRKMINQDMIETFQNWNTPPYTSRPDFIILGCVLKKIISI